jgi:hypothetical protein
VRHIRWPVVGGLCCVPPLLACGGGTTVTSAADANRDGVGIDSASSSSGGVASDAESMDASQDSSCPPFSIPSDAAGVYSCEAGPPGSIGCRSPEGDPNSIYPEGCVLMRPTFGCTEPCCVTMGCTCQQTTVIVTGEGGSGPGDGGLVFACGG